MCCLCSENKGADQLRGYCEAVPRLSFRICRLVVFSQGGSYVGFHIPNFNKISVLKLHLSMLIFFPILCFM